MQQHLEQRQKFQKISDSEKAGVSTNGMQNSPGVLCTAILKSMSFT